MKYPITNGYKRLLNDYKRLNTDLLCSYSLTLPLSKRKSEGNKNHVKLKFYNHAKS